MKDYTFSDITVDLTETLIVDINQKQVDEFMLLSGDTSTIHIDDEYAQSRGYQQRLVHGVLVVSFISQLIGLQLPGKHGVLRTISCNFHRPCYVPDKLTITGRIKKTVNSIRLVQMNVEVQNSSGEIIVTATAESVMKM